jgi:hypothetical protein
MVHLVILQIPRNVKTVAQVKQPLEGQPMCGLVGRKVHGNLGAVVSAAGIVPCHQGVGECELIFRGWKQAMEEGHGTTSLAILVARSKKKLMRMKFRGFV